MRDQITQEERRKKRRNDTRKAMILLAVTVVFLIAAIVGAVVLVSRFMPEKEEPPKESETVLPTEQEETEEPVTPEESDSAPESDPATEQARTFVSGMTLEQKVAQMFMITPDALTGVTNTTAAGDATKAAYTERPVGGIIYQSGNLTGREQTKDMLTNMMTYSWEASGLPVFLGVDEEGGTVGRIASNMEYGIADVGDMSDIGATGDPQNAYTVGSEIGGYLSELGFNMDFAPVADVLTNPENQVVRYRSFGSDAETVKNMALSELQGLKERGVYGVMKHFPGHGATAEDSHNGAASTGKSLDELRAEELVPFQAAVDAGADFIMVGHISVPGITGNEVPSSLSAYMVNEVLRSQMGYRGIIITDAMNMGAITSGYSSSDAAVTAILAGVDMILMPENFAEAYDGVINAVNNGVISQERIDESVVRIVRLKQSMSQGS